MARNQIVSRGSNDKPQWKEDLCALQEGVERIRFIARSLLAVNSLDDYEREAVAGLLMDEADEVAELRASVEFYLDSLVSKEEVAQ